MSEKPTRPKARRKLNRNQVQEILERNVKLYRDEESFVPYLIELAIYLLEYEYNWEESGAAPPEGLPVGPEEVDQANGMVDRGNSQIFHRITPNAFTPTDRDCPHCGSPIGDAYVCENCKNLTR